MSNIIRSLKHQMPVTIHMREICCQKKMFLHKKSIFTEDLMTTLIKQRRRKSEDYDLLINNENQDIRRQSHQSVFIDIIYIFKDYSYAPHYIQI